MSLTLRSSCAFSAVAIAAILHTLTSSAANSAQVDIYDKNSTLDQKGVALEQLGSLNGLKDKLIELEISLVKPTQMTVGKADAQDMLRRFRLEAEGKREIPNRGLLNPPVPPVDYIQEFMNDNPFPGVIGPDGHIYITDGHHRASMVEIAQRKYHKSIKIRVEITEVFHDWPHFAEGMCRAGKLYFDKRTRDQILEKIAEAKQEADKVQILIDSVKGLPGSLSEIGNSPMRAIVGNVFSEVRLKSTYFKDYIEFFEGELLEEEGVRVPNTYRPCGETGKMTAACLQTLVLKSVIRDRIFKDPYFLNFLKRNYREGMCKKKNESGGVKEESCESLALAQIADITKRLSGAVPLSAQEQALAGKVEQLPCRHEASGASFGGSPGASSRASASEHRRLVIPPEWGRCLNPVETLPRDAVESKQELQGAWEGRAKNKAFLRTLYSLTSDDAATLGALIEKGWEPESCRSSPRYVTGKSPRAEPAKSPRSSTGLSLSEFRQLCHSACESGTLKTVQKKDHRSGRTMRAQRCYCPRSDQYFSGSQLREGPSSGRRGPKHSN